MNNIFNNLIQKTKINTSNKKHTSTNNNNCELLSSVIKVCIKQLANIPEHVVYVSFNG